MDYKSAGVDVRADKAWVSNEQQGKFRYPCVYMVHKDNSLSLKWSSKKSCGHFGVPKLIYSSGRPVSVGFLLTRLVNTV